MKSRMYGIPNNQSVFFTSRGKLPLSPFYNKFMTQDSETNKKNENHTSKTTSVLLKNRILNAAKEMTFCIKWRDEGIIFFFVLLCKIEEFGAHV